MRRKNRNKPEQAPVTAPLTPAVPAVPDAARDELRDLRERLAKIEDRAAQTGPEEWSPLAARRRERADWLAAHTRTDADEQCPACGKVGGEQRRITGSLFRRSPAWACVPCVDVVITGFGTNSVRTYSEAVALDRLACLAAGMERPTRDFRALAGRYGLTFRLAIDSEAGDGTAWSHLGGQLALWREAGVKALRREAAGFGVFPAPTAADLRTEMMVGFVADPTHPLGRRHGHVPKPAEVPTAQQVAARLAAEEEAIEVELRAQARRAADKAEEEARKAERARIQREYRAAVKAQEQVFARHRRELRKARTQVLASAEVRADFNAIVSGL